MQVKSQDFTIQTGYISIKPTQRTYVAIVPSRLYIGFMHEQSQTEFADENKGEFSFDDPQKEQIYGRSIGKIRERIHEIDAREKNNIEKIKHKFGSIFEVLASEEEHLKHPETAKQKQLRELIERSYSQAELILGTSHERPSKPDGISVTFDEHGRLVIDEIIESKSSENALQHGIDKAQPPKTLETIGNIVILFNKLLAGESTTTIKPQDSDLSLDQRIKRDVALQNIQNELLSFVTQGEKITFSPELIYKVIVPHDVTIPQFNPHFIEEYGYIVKMEIAQSSFSRHDVHQIIEEQT